MLKINSRDFKNIWFCSDIHAYHDKDFLYEPRGCATKEEHTEMVRDGINKLAGKNDLILNLGDQALTCTYNQYLDFWDSINCHSVWSIIGNHDRRFERMLKYVEEWNYDLPISDEGEKAIELWKRKNYRSLTKLEDVQIKFPSKVVGKKDLRYNMMLSHFPMLLWNNIEYGTWNLHGHCHGNLPLSSIEYTEHKRLDVGVDNALKYSGNVMFSFDEVRDIMSKKKITKLDHH
jgi:calcineurin-like phosphoesterase family protein